MRTSLINNAARCLAVACLLACPYVQSVAVAKPQNKASLNRLMDKPSENASSVARPSTSKSETSASAPSTKEQKSHDKQTISRCWKRLMGMAREVSHAHRNSR